MSQYAVVLVGSHQYQVQEKTVFEAERLDAKKKPSSEAKEITLDQVLLLSENGSIKVGKPFVPKASVTCEVLGEEKQLHTEDLKLSEMIMLSLNTTITVGKIERVKANEIDIHLRIPVVPIKGDSVGIARNINGHWRLIGYGKIV